MTGIRGSQARSVEIKRNAAGVGEAIGRTPAPAEPHGRFLARVAGA